MEREKERVREGDKGIRKEGDRERERDRGR